MLAGANNKFKPTLIKYNLDALANSEKDSWFRHICLSVRPQGITRFPRDRFHKILYSRIFRKSMKKIQFPLKSDSITGTVHEDLCTVMILPS